MAKLGDVCEILNGYAFKSERYVDTGIRIIRISNVQKGYIEDSAPVFYPSDDENAKKYSLEENDLLISLTGNVGRVAVLSKLFLPAALNQRVACIRIKDENSLHKPYLFHLLNSDLFEAKCIEASKGVAQKNMSTQWLKDYEISLPIIDEQRRIAAALDKVTDLIAQRRAQLDKLDMLVKSRFVEMFGDPFTNPYGWPKKHFDEISTIITDGEHATPKRSKKGIYLLSARNILNHSIQVDDVDYIDETEYDRISKRIVPASGDILISCSGSIGRCCVVPQNFKFQMVRSVALIRFGRCINPVFAEWLIASDELQRQINQSSTQSSQANLFQGRIKKLYAYVPPIDLQNQFSSFVEQTEKSKLTIHKSLDKLEIMKNALMQRYFG